MTLLALFVHTVGLIVLNYFYFSFIIYEWNCLPNDIKCLLVFSGLKHNVTSFLCNSQLLFEHDINLLLFMTSFWTYVNAIQNFGVFFLSYIQISFVLYSFPSLLQFQWAAASLVWNPACFLMFPSPHTLIYYTNFFVYCVGRNFNKSIH